MHKIIFLGLISCALALTVPLRTSLSPPERDFSSKWARELILNEEKGVKVRWNTKEENPGHNNPGNKKWLTMEVFAPTLGYVGIGFSPNGGMTNADMVIGWVDSTGKPHIRDFHGIGNTAPVEDEQQDYKLISATETEEGTTIQFRRLWTTCDEKGDLKITNGTTRLIWAFGSTDPIMSGAGEKNEIKFDWHGGENRGVRSLFLQNPPRKDPEIDDSVKFWDATMDEQHVEPLQTTYICRLLKFPEGDSDTKHQMIGYEQVIKSVNKVHHATIFECIFNDEDIAKFAPLVNAPGDHCIKRVELATKCGAVFIATGLGFEKQLLPEHVGQPMGVKHGGASYYFIQVHYDNPTKETFTDSSGLRIWYSDKLRQYDSGVILTGHRASAFELTPPKQEDFYNYGICPGACTEKALPKDGINLFSIFHHGHQIVRKMRLRHIRKGTELPMIAEDNYYDFNYQQSIPFEQEIKVLPGDDLITECQSNTMDRKDVTLGGGQSFKEMCLQFIFYYPKISLRTCASQPEMFAFYNSLGVQNVSGPLLEVGGYPYTPDAWVKQTGKERDDILGNFDTSVLLELEKSADLESGNGLHDHINITQPSALSHMSVGDYWREKLDWKNHRFAQQVQEALRVGPHYSYCMAESDRRYHLANDHLFDYPKITNPIVALKDTECSH